MDPRGFLEASSSSVAEALRMALGEQPPQQQQQQQHAPPLHHEQEQLEHPLVRLGRRPVGAQPLRLALTRGLSGA